MAEVFISYSRKDSQLVLPVVERLQEEGIDVWIDKDGIESGDAFKKEIVSALEACRIVLFFSSEASNCSPWTEKEINVANAYKRPIIPVKLDDSLYNPGLMLDLAGLDYVDLCRPEMREAMIDKLCRSLHNKLGHGQVARRRILREDTPRMVDKSISAESYYVPTYLELHSGDGLVMFKGGLLQKRCGYKRRGKVVLRPTYEWAESSFHSGRAAVIVGGRYGYIDASGKMVIQAEFEEADSFTGMFARVKKDGLWGYIDMMGKPYIPITYVELEGGYGDRMLARSNKDGRYGYIGKNGDVLIPFQYNDAKPFHGGYAIVSNGKWGVIDEKGSVVVPLDYYHIDPLSGGVFKTEKNCKYGIVFSSFSRWEPAADGIIADGSVLIAYEIVDRYTTVIKGLFSFDGIHRQTGVRRVGEFQDGKAPAESISGVLGMIDSSTLSFEPFAFVEDLNGNEHAVLYEGLWGVVKNEVIGIRYSLFEPRRGCSVDSLRSLRFVIPLSCERKDVLFFKLRKLKEKNE